MARSASSPPWGIENGLWENRSCPVLVGFEHGEIDDPAEVEPACAIRLRSSPIRCAPCRPDRPRSASPAKKNTASPVLRPGWRFGSGRSAADESWRWGPLTLAVRRRYDPAPAAFVTGPSHSACRRSSRLARRPVREWRGLVPPFSTQPGEDLEAETCETLVTSAS